jgi:hypothetical protein
MHPSDSRSPEPTLPTLNATHDAVGAWFLGPKAENHEYLRKNFEIIVKQIQDGRQAYFPDDEVGRLCDIFQAFDEHLLLK